MQSSSKTIQGVKIIRVKGQKPTFHIPEGMDGKRFARFKRDNAQEIAAFLEEGEEGDRLAHG